ncbi:MAG: M48 family metallopeptidase [Prolixibacteraceae bacterium]|nr:M48 family metallopeptidase [Burkholderiales bacterium]
MGTLVALGCSKGLEGNSYVMKALKFRNSKLLDGCAFCRQGMIAAAIAVALTLQAAALPNLAWAEGLPDLGDASDASLSEPQERAIGKRIMLEIRNDRTYVDDPELRGYIGALGNRLVSASRGATNDNRRDFEFFLLNDDAINAFALPGGFIGIHSSLLLTTTTESELAGVLGHEIAHVLQRHQARGIDAQKSSALYQLLGLAVAIAAARSNSSSAGQATEAALATTAALQYQNQLNYSRDFEREADRLGIQILSRAGFDINGMVGFFERMQRANRHNVDAKFPGYLQTHPLTSERIADMQNRVDSARADFRAIVAETAEYKFAKAKMRALSMNANEAARFFRASIAEQTVLRNRSDNYGLALSLLRLRDFAAAEKELATARGIGPAQPWIEMLAADIQAGKKSWNEAIKIYRVGMQSFPEHRAFLYGLVDALYESGQTDAAIEMVSEKLRNVQDDPLLFDLAAKGYERKKQRLAQHRAVGEAFFIRGNMVGAIDQLELAIKAKDADFYEISSAEARLREFKSAFQNRVLLPGEKRDRGHDREKPFSYDERARNVRNGPAVAPR